MRTAFAVMEYKIISVSALWSFDKALAQRVRAVNDSIALGWEPQGRLMAAEHRISQAMIKRR